MLISRADDGKLSGKYCTEVETQHGAAGGEQDLYGVVGNQTLHSFGFAVSFKVGAVTYYNLLLLRFCLGDLFQPPTSSKFKKIESNTPRASTHNIRCLLCLYHTAYVTS